MFRALVGLLALCALTAQGQRLPDTVTPHHYILKFTPDLKTAKFGGEETIHSDVNRPTRDITLNAVEIDFQQVTVQALPKGKVQTARVSLDPQKEMATFTVDEELPKGPVEIKVQYTGKLNDELRGFYLGKANGRNYASTQFEPTDARRAFPSWDEPAYKAPFDISIVVDKDDTAISNGKIVKDEPGPGADKHTLTFSMTPKMSTYLVAIAVGDFQCLEGESEGTPIRVCATPDKVQLGKYALESAQHILKYYNRYYDAKYPFKKLDIVAVPDFEAGAMENTAAIFYRETLLLIPENASVVQHQEVYSVLAHEMAHQWFGDLVTMQWWNDIWLNEGFATWMATKPMKEWKPEWRADLDEVSESIKARNTDSLRSTRPIRQRAETSSEINELFDAIAYEKTAAVLRMIESYVGAETFQKGVNLYIKEHSYANAAAEDFWGALTRASGKPVDKIMSGFVTQAGLPLISASRQGNKLTLSQRRFVFGRQAFNAGFPEVWEVPVCTRAVTSKSVGCRLLTGRSKLLEPVVPGFTVLNVDGRGYYRAAYDPADLTAFAKDARKIAATFPEAGERMALIDDEWALVRVGQHQISDFMNLATGLGSEQDSHVMDTLTDRVAYIGDYLVPSARPQFQTWVRNHLGPQAKDLGWNTAANESDERRELRKEVLYTLGYQGRDPDVLARARDEVRRVMDGSSQIDSNLYGTVVTLAAIDGDATLFDAYQAQLKKAKSPAEYYRYLYGLTEFRDPALVQRGLEMLLAPEMRNQDAPHYLNAYFRVTDSQAAAWDFTKKRWTDLQHHWTTWGGGTVVQGTHSFCDAKLRNDVQQFFTTHKVVAAERGMKQSIEHIDYCIDLRTQQAPKLATWLRSNGGSAVAGAK
jgi:aminopeptidase N/puromycin-sensitive aminopeptidase